MGELITVDFRAKNKPVQEKKKSVVVLIYHYDYLLTEIRESLIRIMRQQYCLKYGGKPEEE